MRIAVLGDIHSNYDALVTVLADARARGVDDIVHVGDVVGYCTEFERCVDRLQSENIAGVHGNHDLMVLGRLTTGRCVPSARQAAMWTRARLTDEVRSYLAALPATITLDDIVVFHASPDSVERPISNVEDADRAFRLLDDRECRARIVFHGHTHKQRVFERRDGVLHLVSSEAGKIALSSSSRYLVSAGSVGQSRDTDPRTAYVIYDTQGSLEMIRLAYDWKSCRRKIREAGLTTELFVSRRRRLARFVRRLTTALRLTRRGTA